MALQSSVPRQLPWKSDESRRNGPEAVRHVPPAQRSYHLVALTGGLMVLAGVGAGLVIFPDRVLDFWHGQKLIQPSAAWSSLLPESVQTRPKPRAPEQPIALNVVAEPSLPPPFDAAALLRAAGMTTSSMTKARPVPVEPAVEVLTEVSQAVEPATLSAPAEGPVKVTAAPEIAPAVLAPAALPRTASEPTQSVAPETAATLKRAQALVERGDIAGARLLLERAASGKEPKVLMALGETYDSAMLARWGARGMKGDPAKARDFYQKAAEAGLGEARARVLAGR
jgi:hypothetical protein